MLINSKVHAKPYLDVNPKIRVEMYIYKKKEGKQVLHDCLKFVPWGVEKNEQNSKNRKNIKVFKYKKEWQQIEMI